MTRTNREMVQIFLKFCAPIPGSLHICPWALLLRPLQSSVLTMGSLMFFTKVRPYLSLCSTLGFLRPGPSNFYIITIRPLRLEIAC
uniref:Uncharacterized protein n=1 Tax=Setaria viridis TaxID=4556 RepID=A0A4U6VUG8_SETVI|nr:hypothetical protein SEVIR_2G176750v2 [Setaria viridis]